MLFGSKCGCPGIDEYSTLFIASLEPVSSNEEDFRRNSASGAGMGYLSYVDILSCRIVVRRKFEIEENFRVNFPSQKCSGE